MPIPYDRKRLLLLEKKQQLFPALQKHISLRNVPDALKLPAQAQETLAQALEQGVQKQRLAIQFLQREPAATIEQLLAAVGGEAESFIASNAGDSPRGSGTDVSQDSKPLKRKEASPLADLLIKYGLYKNQMIAETVASAEYMTGVRDVVLALKHVRVLQGAETETVTLALCAVIVGIIDEMNVLLKEKYAHRVAVLQADEIRWGRFMDRDSLPFSIVGSEDIEALSEMILVGSKLSHAAAAQVAEQESLADMLQLVHLHRRIAKMRDQDMTAFTAARIGFALRVVKDVLSYLETTPIKVQVLAGEDNNWPEWFCEKLKNL